MIRNPYYIIWADAINKFNKHQKDKRNWKLQLWMFVTWLLTLNFWIVIIWLKYFDIITLPLLKIDLFPGTLLNASLAFVIQFGLPFGIINYILVFHKNRYKKYLESHYTKRPIAFIYTIVVAILAFVSGILYGVLT